MSSTQADNAEGYLAARLFASYGVLDLVEEGEFVNEVHVGYVYDDLVNGELTTFTPFESLGEAIRCYEDLVPNENLKQLRLCLTTRKHAAGFVLQREVNFMRRGRCVPFEWVLYAHLPPQ